jgi:MEDS: MEthanogen/methylotroph, DcmR Sensory domain
VATRAENLGGGSDGHAVLFHRDGDELAGRASAYLLEAMRDGGAAIVIATPEHRRMISDRLARAGVDLAAAQASGVFAALDALETMSRFMVADLPNAASFWQVISPLIRRATESFKPVHVFGEMVALLWDFGQVNAAIEVEAMWNELAAQYPFALLCGYPVESVSGERHQDALTEVCRVHTSVVGAMPGQA